jgi:DNA-binding XRE family transcriptional regulator
VSGIGQNIDDGKLEFCYSFEGFKGGWPEENQRKSQAILLNRIGQKIKERRLELGWTQEHLAKLSGYSRVYIVKLENAKVESPGIKALEKIACCLGLKMRSLWK